jgi:hypothetical protein
MYALFLAAAGTWVAAPVAESEPAARPKATIAIDPHRAEFRLLVEISTASGKTYSVPFDVQTNSSVLARDRVLGGLVHANWLAGKTGDFELEVFGVRAKGGKIDPVKSLVVIAPKENGREIAKLDATEGVKVEVREGDGKSVAKPLPVGPDLGAEAYVEFDFSPIPIDTGPWEVTMEVHTTLKDFTASDGHNAPNGSSWTVLCEGFASGLGTIAFKAEVVDKKKVRVYGGVYDGKFYPATRGTVASPNLKKEQLPKITNPPAG